MKDIEPVVITNILATYNILLDRRSSALPFLELVLSIDSVKISSYPIGLDYLDYIPPNIRGDDLSGKLL